MTVSIDLLGSLGLAHPDAEPVEEPDASMDAKVRALAEVDDDVPSVDDDTHWRHKMLDPDRPHLDLDRTLGPRHERTGPEPEPPALTVHQELTVSYIRTLIGWVARGQTVREQAPPEHVFDRIERLLGIEDGVA